MNPRRLLDIAHRSQRTGTTQALVEAAKATGGQVVVINGREAERLRRDHGVRAVAIDAPDLDQQLAGQRLPLLVDTSVLLVIAEAWAASLKPPT